MSLQFGYLIGHILARDEPSSRERIVRILPPLTIVAKPPPFRAWVCGVHFFYHAHERTFLAAFEDMYETRLSCSFENQGKPKEEARVRQCVGVLGSIGKSSINSAKRNIFTLQPLFQIFCVLFKCGRRKKMCPI